MPTEEEAAKGYLAKKSEDENVHSSFNCHLHSF